MDDTEIEIEVERKKILVAWLREFGVLLLLYLVAYGAAMWAIVALPAGTKRTLLIVAPIVPGLLMIWRAVVNYRLCDEFVRHKVLEAAAQTAVFTAVWTLIYAYLEPLGFPHLNIGLVQTVAWPVFSWQMIRLLRMRG